jgi:hypothetical protein
LVGDGDPECGDNEERREGDEADDGADELAHGGVDGVDAEAFQAPEAVRKARGAAAR